MTGIEPRTSGIGTTALPTEPQPLPKLVHFYDDAKMSSFGRRKTHFSISFNISYFQSPFWMKHFSLFSIFPIFGWLKFVAFKGGCILSKLPTSLSLFNKVSIVSIARGRQQARSLHPNPIKKYEVYHQLRQLLHYIESNWVKVWTDVHFF